ncbi:MAG: glycosyltransferase family 2 protein [Cyanobacteria bacterium SID2]|nr:glycosyltransferase family 2 protein [Cyanobacteria bacterium SID2]MBP0006189.1 glycosyltransferase family 2 protein [Cyanobacteria bacterium SBC]
MHFSIVITTYNRLSLLKRSIDSALAQTLPCEVIVADDCSCDGTRDYVLGLQNALQNVGDTRLVYYRNAVNAGHSATMNAGVSLASGEWIKPLDDDDYLASNCIEEMWLAIQRHSASVLCSCQAAQVSPDEVELSCTPRTGPGKAFYIPQEDIHYGMLLEIVPFGTPVQVAFQKEAFWKAEGWDSKFDGNCDDIDSWIRIAQFGDAIFINRCLAYRTVWEGAYNRQLPLQKRLTTNILMKEKIYNLVSSKYREHIPKVQHVTAYLKLHWAAVAFKQRRFLDGLKVLFPAIFCLSAWELFVRAMLFRQSPWLARTKWFDDYTFSLPRSPQKSVALDSDPELQHYIEHQRYVLQLQWSWSAICQGKLKTGLKMGSNAIVRLLQEKLVRRVPHRLKIHKIPIRQQVEANTKTIEDIYDLLQQKYRSNLPNLKDLRSYLHLRWAWAALKQGKILTFLRVAFPAVFSLKAWQIWLETVRHQHQEHRQKSVRKWVLLDDRD